MTIKATDKVVCIRRAPWSGEDMKPMSAAPRYGEVLTVRSVHVMASVAYYRFVEFRSYNIFSSGHQSSDENQFHSENFRPIDLIETMADQVGLEPTVLSQRIKNPLP